MRPTNLVLPFLCLLAFATGIEAQTSGQPVTKTYTYTGNPISIPGSNTGISAVAEIYVPDNITISSVTAQVQITYPTVGDLKVALFSARGTRTVLLSNNCGKLVNINTTFDDTAQSKYSDFCPVEAGRGPFRGNEPLANSKGENAGGYWDLVVQNTNSNSSTGVIQAFSLTIAGAPITTPTFSVDTIVNSGSLIGGFIAPGELISIYGLALGPQTGVAAPAGTLPTTLGGTTVTVNGVAAPVLYSSAGQLNIQIPYSVTPGTTAKIQIQGAAATSSTVTVDVLSSAAGLFTSQTNGRGGVAAANQNGTVNSATNPAPAGSYVALYAEGLGAVSPAVKEGTVTANTPLSNTTAAPAVIIGGLSAPVLFSGLAPGFTGLYQINVQVPPTTPSGPNRVFIVMPNGFSSQNGVFLYVQ